MNRSFRVKTAERGTTNTNDRGSSYDRRARKLYLVREYGDGKSAPCYSCSQKVSGVRLEADRIIPGILGGTYQRTNIRPCCPTCNIRSGNAVKDLLRDGVDRETIIWMCIRGEV